MTVESRKNKSGPFNVSGTSGTYPREFLVLNESHVRVIRVRDGVEADLTVGIGHTGIGSAFGTVVISAGIASGDKIYLLRSVPALQLTDYNAQGRVRTDQVENDFDLTMMAVQDIAEEQSRALRLPVSAELSGEEALRAAIDAPLFATQARDAATEAAVSAARVAFDASVEVTVGPGGAFSTINAALASLSVRTSRRYSAEGVTAAIRLRPGFVMAEQVLVRSGLDLSWIAIVSDDAIVPVTAAAVTVPLSAPDSLIPVFGATGGSKLPVIGAKFAFPVNTHGKDGVAVILGSEVRFLPGGSGVVRARNGLKVLYGSKASCYIPGLVIGGDGIGAGTTRGVDFSYAANRAVHVAHGSQTYLARGDYRYSEGDMAVYVIWKSHGDFYQSTAAHAAGTAFLVRDDSTANCRETEVANAGENGYHAIHLGRINARSRVVGQISWVGDGARNCGGYAVLANDNSYIAADSLDCDNCTGSAAVSASAGSMITFGSGRARFASTRALWSQSGGTIVANDAVVTDALQSAIVAQGGVIYADRADAGRAATNGILAFEGGQVNANSAIADSCNRGVEARDGKIYFKNGSAQNCTERALSVIDGGDLHCMGAVTTGALSFHLTVRGGGVVKALNFNGAIDLRDGGGIVFNFGGTGAPSQPVNVPTANGVIYR